MSLIQVSDHESTPLRDNPRVASFDLSGAEDVFALNERASALHRDVVARVKRINDWVDALGIEQLMNERMDQAFERAKHEGTVAAMEAAMGLRQDSDFASFIAKQDPIIVTQHLGELSRFYNDSVRQLDVICDYSSSFVPEMKEQMRRTVIEMMKALSLTSIAYDTVFSKMLDRIEHGVPRWDNELGCEMELDEAGIPTMDDTVASSAAEEQKESIDAIAARLLSSLFGDESVC